MSWFFSNFVFISQDNKNANFEMNLASQYKKNYEELLKAEVRKFLEQNLEGFSSKSDDDKTALVEEYYKLAIQMSEKMQKGNQIKDEEED